MNYNALIDSRCPGGASWSVQDENGTIVACLVSEAVARQHAATLMGGARSLGATGPIRPGGLGQYVARSLDPRCSPSAPHGVEDGHGQLVACHNSIADARGHADDLQRASTGKAVGGARSLGAVHDPVSGWGFRDGRLGQPIDGVRDDPLSGSGWGEGRLGQQVDWSPDQRTSQTQIKPDPDPDDAEAHEVPASEIEDVSVIARALGLANDAALAEGRGRLQLGFFRAGKPPITHERGLRRFGDRFGDDLEDKSGWIEAERRVLWLNADFETDELIVTVGHMLFHEWRREECADDVEQSSADVDAERRAEAYGREILDIVTDEDDA